MRAVTANPARPWVCPTCSRAFGRKGELDRHKIIHLPDKEARKYPCPQCPYRALQKSNLQTHISSVHHRLRPFKCNFPGCPRSFGDGSSLNRHQSNVHNVPRKRSREYAAAAATALPPSLFRMPSTSPSPPPSSPESSSGCQTPPPIAAPILPVYNAADFIPNPVSFPTSSPFENFGMAPAPAMQAPTAVPDFTATAFGTMGALNPYMQACAQQLPQAQYPTQAPLPTYSGLYNSISSFPSSSALPPSLSFPHVPETFTRQLTDEEVDALLREVCGLPADTDLGFTTPPSLYPPAAPQWDIPATVPAYDPAQNYKFPPAPTNFSAFLHQPAFSY